MKIGRTFFLFNAIWELLRFFILFAALILVFQLVILTNRQAVFWLIVLGSTHLVLPAGLIVLYIDPERSYPILNLTRLAKILGLFSSLLLLILEPFGTGLRTYGLKFLPSPLTPVAMLLSIILIDLIFLFFLLSYSRGNAASELSDQNQTDLPDYHETEIVDKLEEH